MTEHERPRFDFRTRLEWMDTDASGIYHNSTVVRFIEGAEARLMRERGLEGHFPSAPRVRFEVDFLIPLFNGQDVTTTLELVALGTSSMTWEFEVWGEEFAGRPRNLAARGSYVTVYVGGDALKTAATSGAKPLPLPAEWVAALTGEPQT